MISFPDPLGQGVHLERVPFLAVTRLPQIATLPPLSCSTWLTKIQIFPCQSPARGQQWLPLLLALPRYPGPPGSGTRPGTQLHVLTLLSHTLMPHSTLCFLICPPLCPPPAACCLSPRHLMGPPHLRKLLTALSR